MGDGTISSNAKPGTEEAEALASALNHSAERVQTLWFSFLTFMVYLAIATGTTTHRMLFLEEPLNLPVLDIKLPLLGFYILTPVIFVVFHFYMLLNLVLLARTADGFKKALVHAFPEDGEARETFRMRIENTLFVQLLVGGRLEREGINAKLLGLMALITLALAPVLLLLMFEVKFLPYHSEWITWLHRGLLALDFALVWTLWPGYRSGWGVCLWPKRSWKLVLPGVLSAMALAYAVMVATFPDERMYLATNWLRGIAPVNTLDLHGEDLIDDAKLAHILEKNESTTGAQRWVATLPFAGRDLTGADLSSADVRHVDFTGAILNRANLKFAWAEKARLDNAQVQGASLDLAHLQGASLNSAQLQGASLDGAQLQGASLDFARLQGASLDFARLQGASLNSAQLQGASLNDASLQGASLNSAHLQGASLNSAQLQGASLNDASLQGASLNSAHLQGAWLNSAHLQGASLGKARSEDSLPPRALPKDALIDELKLHIAVLDAMPQGVSLDLAQLQDASLVDVCAWRADARQVVRRETDPKQSPNKVHECDWTAASFAALKQRIAAVVPEGDARRAAMERIDQRLDPTILIRMLDKRNLCS